MKLFSALGWIVVLTACGGGGGASSSSTSPSAEQATAATASATAAPTPTTVPDQAPSATASSPSAAPASTVKFPANDQAEPSPTSQGAPAALYAELFQKGVSWTVKVKTTTGFYEDKPVNKVSNSKGKCSVVESETKAWAVISFIECDPIGDPATTALHGWWFATAKGLYKADGVREKLDDEVLSSARLTIKAAPSIAKVKHEDKENEGFGFNEEVSNKGAVWCYSMESWGGDEAWEVNCWEAGKGFVSGKWGWAGGSTHDNEYVATKN